MFRQAAFKQHHIIYIDTVIVGGKRGTALIASRIFRNRLVGDGCTEPKDRSLFMSHSDVHTT